MKCRELMKVRVETVSPDDSIANAARRMRDSNVGFLPVCEKSGRIFGTLTDRDIAIRCVAEGKDIALPVSKIATREVIACAPEDDVSRAETLMSQHHISRILCMDGDNLVGVISLSDIAEKEDPELALRTFREVASREVSGAHA